MPPDPIRVEETLAWIRKSRKDLWRAESVLTLDPPDTEDCLFHCQQAVEKSLKAFLVWRDQSFRRTHDLVELTRQCVDLEPTLGDAMSGLAPLTRFAWELLLSTVYLGFEPRRPRHLSKQLVRPP